MPSRLPTSERISIAVGAGLLAGVSTVAVLATALGHASLWRDEGTTAILERHSFGGLIRLLFTTRTSERAQPLYYLVLWPWRHLVGESEVALRLPSLAFMVGAAAVLYVALRSIGVPAAVAALSAALFPALPVNSWYALEARPYAFVVLLGTVEIALLFRARASKASLWMPAWFALVLALASPVAGFAGVGGTAALLIAQRSKTARRTGASTAIGCSLALAAAAVLSAAGSAASVPPPRSAVAGAMAVGYELVLGRSLAWSVDDLRTKSVSALSSQTGDALLALALGALVAGTVIGAIRHLRPAKLRVLAFGTGPILAAAIALAAFAAATRFPIVGRHELFALPALFVVVVCGVAAWALAWRVAVVVVVVLVSAASMHGILAGERYGKDDYRAVGHLLRRCDLSPATVAVATQPEALAYYDPRFSGVRASAFATALRSLQQGGRTSVIVVDTNYADPRGRTSLRLSRSTPLDLVRVKNLAVLARPGALRCAPGS